WPRCHPYPASAHPCTPHPGPTVVLVQLLRDRWTPRRPLRVRARWTRSLPDRCVASVGHQRAEYESFGQAFAASIRHGTRTTTFQPYGVRGPYSIVPSTARTRSFIPWTPVPVPSETGSYALPSS